ncbi:hypothetical protein TNCV_2376921 [Trichonephila clavipes]|nr:hypothetical protein TNCV_2376921 [Trichonephila clavipes]
MTHRATVPNMATLPAPHERNRTLKTIQGNNERTPPATELGVEIPLSCSPILAAAFAQFTTFPLYTGRPAHSKSTSLGIGPYSKE